MIDSVKVSIGSEVDILAASGGRKSLQPAVCEGVSDSRERMRTLCLMFPSEIGDAA